MSDDKQGMRWKVTKAVRASNLPAPARHIMLTLADIADVGTAEIPERWTPSLTVLARETGLGRSTVAAHLRTLEADGWVVRTRPTTASALAQGERTRYQLKVPADASPVAELGQEEASPAEGLPSPAPGQASPAQGLPSPAPGHRVRSSSDPLTSSDLSSSATPPMPTEEPREDVERICNYLAEWVVKNGSRRPTITKKWHTEARLLIDKDGKSIEEIREVIAWSQRDEFWKANILSMPTLRKQYDRLKLASQRGQSGPASPTRATGANRHVDDITPEQRAARNPFANAIRASQAGVAK